MGSVGGGSGVGSGGGNGSGAGSGGCGIGITAFLLGAVVSVVIGCYYSLKTTEESSGNHCASTSPYGAF
jgi:hypothetical protein